MIVTTTCTYPLHPLPSEEELKGNKYAFILPMTRGHVYWCKRCRTNQKRRWTLIQKNGGLVGWHKLEDKYHDILKERFGGRPGMLGRYASDHAPQNVGWCSKGWHYAPVEQMNKTRMFCSYCSYATIKKCWSSYAQLGYLLKKRRRQLRELTEKVRLQRAHARELEHYIQLLEKRRKKEENHANFLAAV